MKQDELAKAYVNLGNTLTHTAKKKLSSAEWGYVVAAMEELHRAIDPDNHRVLDSLEGGVWPEELVEKWNSLR